MPDLPWCVGCGAPRPAGPPGPEPGRSSTAWIVAAAAALVVTVLAGAAVLALRPTTIFGGAPGAQVTSGTPAASSPFPGTVPAGAAPATGPSATDELGDQAGRDRTAVEGATDRWVPQLSSKRPGTVDAGVTYDADRILAHYRGLAARYPGTALLWSGDWPVFTARDYWVVIVAEPFGTAAEANAWCDARGFAADDCLAKKLSHTGGPRGSTVPRS